MLYWTVVLLIIALVANVVGFGVIATGVAGIAKIFAYVLLVLLIVGLLVQPRGKLI